MNITSTPFGTTTDGQEITQFTLANANHCQVQIINYGAAITAIAIPDHKGQIADIVLGYDTLKGYENDTAYFGAIVGRYGNRIQNGRFTLNGQTHVLATNNGPNHLHGGPQGFHKMIWQAQTTDKGVVLTHISPDGHEGYPGTLTATVAYTLTEQNELKIQYHATTDRPTIANLTNHSYFNLAGTGSILDHILTMKASHFTPVDSTLIPTGEIRPVHNTPMDFTTPTRIGGHIDNTDEQLQHGGGYDHNWVIDDWNKTLREIVYVHDPKSGRTMTVSTTEPGVQFYTGNFLNGTQIGKNQTAYQQRTGFCLETQHFPNSPNQPDFPSTELKPDQAYTSETVYKFSTI